MSNYEQPIIGYAVKNTKKGLLLFKTPSADSYYFAYNPFHFDVYPRKEVLERDLERYNKFYKNSEIVTIYGVIN